MSQTGGLIIDDQEEVLKKAKDGEPEFVKALEMARKRAADPEHVNEEALAYLVQNAPELGIVRCVIAAIRQWIYRVTDGKFIDLSEADLRAMAIAALRAQGRELKTGKPYYMTTYHGSPVDKFHPEPDNPLGKLRWKFMSSGEGGEAFTYGHYVAQR